MIIPNPLRRAGADRRNPHIPDVARVLVKLEEHVKKSDHAVRARKNEPVVLISVADQLAELQQILRWLNPNGWQLNNICAEQPEPIAQYSSLPASTCNHNP